MKRRASVRHLQQHGCEVVRDGGNHSTFVNRATVKASRFDDMPINEQLARKICKDLGVPTPD